MLWGFAAALVTILAQAPANRLILELRVFNGVDEVTTHTRVVVHRAGDRGEPLVHTRSADGRVHLEVPPGLYDVQAIHERDGRVLNIRWANRLVVMPYPDEQGQHLEVVNFKNGYGALQVRGTTTARPEVTLYEAGKRDKPVPTGVDGHSYVLFIVPAGVYDLYSRSGAKATWQTGLEVPADRTRFWLVQ